MTTDILAVNGTILVVKAAGGDAAITLASLAATKARQSVKFDFGAVRADVWGVYVSIETGGTVTAIAGKTIDFYISPSPDNTLFAGGASGTDLAYQDGNEDAFVKQLVHAGPLTLTETASTVQTTQVGVYMPISRYGSLVVMNNSGQTLETNDDEHQIQLIPLFPQGQ